MAIKVSQGAAWVLALLGAAGVHSGIYMGVKYKSKWASAAMRTPTGNVDHGESQHGQSTHGDDSHGTVHDTAASHGEPQVHAGQEQKHEDKTAANAGDQGHGAAQNAHHEPTNNDHAVPDPHVGAANDHADAKSEPGSHTATKLPKETKTSSHQETQAKAPEHQVHWSYEGDTGPEFWAKLTSANSMCDEGKEQSPVDIYSVKKQAKLADLKLRYKAGFVSWYNNGHTLQADIPEGSTLTLEGQEYALKQFHFHTPSEHKEDGIAYPMELHLVHKNEEGGLSVIGIFIEEGDRNKMFDILWQSLPTESNAPKKQIKFDLNRILPAKMNYYSYNGSLTTPPCSEGVKWFVLSQPIYFSGRQISDFEHIFKRNSRPAQRLNERVILAK